MITVDIIMKTVPCVSWPRSRVEASLSKLDTSSWTGLVESARKKRWSVVSLGDIRLTLCRHAARRHLLAVLIPWVVDITHRRVASQRERWPRASPEVSAVWDRLERWHGGRDEIREIREIRGAAATYAAAYYAADAATTYADDAAAALLGDLARRLDAADAAEEGGFARWTGIVGFDAVTLAAPLSWRKPRTIFVNSMSDLFHDGFSDEQIAAVFGVMAACPQHTFIVLTKRARRMREWFKWLDSTNYAPGHVLADCLKKMARLSTRFDLRFLDQEWLIHLVNVVNGHATWKHAPDGNPADGTRPRWPLPNVWLGVSVENQATADERIPHLLATPAALRMVSAEPLLGPLYLTPYLAGIQTRGVISGDGELMAWPAPPLDWVIAGCESGRNARACSTEWLRSLRDQCAETGVAYFLKQAREDMSLSASDSHGKTAMRMGPGSTRKPGGIIGLPYLDGVQWAQMPVSR